MWNGNDENQVVIQTYFCVSTLCLQIWIPSDPHNLNHIGSILNEVITLN